MTSGFWEHMDAATIEALALAEGEPALHIGATELPAPPGWLAHETAGTAELPFPDATFAGVRIDRSLQHADDVAAAAAEIWRVARHGARIVAIEPDWDTLAFDAGPLSATRAVARAYADGVRNPIVGRQIARRLRRLGATSVTAEPRAAAITQLDHAEAQYDLTKLAEATLNKSAARAWLNTLSERDADGTFLCAVTYFLVSAQKP
jgi:ubiquinone/menaquinone biosynthesis C-methylase UbiE